MQDITLTVSGHRGCLDLSTYPILLKELSPIIEYASASMRQRVAVTLDLSAVKFISPVAIATIVAFVYKLYQHHDYNGVVKYIEPRDEAVCAYLARMDAFKTLTKQEPEIGPKKRWSSKGRFQELMFVEREDLVDTLAGAISDIVDNGAHLSHDVKQALGYSFAEILGNAFYHANSNVPPLIAAQYYPASDFIEVAIVDCGIGIRASLRKNPTNSAKVVTHADALLLSLERGVTGDPTPKHKGEGLFFSEKIVVASKGIFMLYSGDSFMETSEKGRRTGESPLPWNGTVCAFRIGTRTEVSISDIFDEYAPLGEDYW